MAGIIKANGERSYSGLAKPAEYSFADISKQADDYLDQVRIQAEAILTNAKEEATQAAAQAKNEARQAAIQAVEITMRQELDARLSTLLPALQELVGELQQEKQAWIEHWSHNLLNLALGIAEKVVRRELSHQPEITLDLTREALELASGSARITLHLNPTDLETLGSSVQLLLDQMSHLGEVDVVGDASIEAGGAVVATEYGKVDLQLATQLERIREELT